MTQKYDFWLVLMNYLPLSGEGYQIYLEVEWCFQVSFHPNILPGDDLLSLNFRLTVLSALNSLSPETYLNFPFSSFMHLLLHFLWRGTLCMWGGGLEGGGTSKRGEVCLCFGVSAYLHECLFPWKGVKITPLGLS